jgi:hypothetical protein
MIDSFATHAIETAPAAARPLLELVRSEYGHVPDVFAKMAEPPAAMPGVQGAGAQR